MTSFDDLQWTTPQLQYIASLLHELQVAKQCVTQLNRANAQLLDLLLEQGATATRNNHSLLSRSASSMALQSKILSTFTTMFGEMSLSEPTTFITNSENDDDDARYMEEREEEYNVNHVLQNIEEDEDDDEEEYVLPTPSKEHDDVDDHNHEEEYEDKQEEEEDHKVDAGDSDAELSNHDVCASPVVTVTAAPMVRHRRIIRRSKDRRVQIESSSLSNTTTTTTNSDDDGDDGEANNNDVADMGDDSQQERTVQAPSEQATNRMGEMKTPIVSRKNRPKRKRVMTPSPAKPLFSPSCTTSTISDSPGSESPVAPSTAIKAIPKKMKQQQQQILYDDDETTELSRGDAQNGATASCDLRLVPLCDSVVHHLLHDFHVQVCKPCEFRRFGFYPHNIPLSIQMFNDAQWSSNVVFSCDEESFEPAENMAFEATVFHEALLDEWDSFDFLANHEDACVIGIGNDLMVTRLDPANHRNIADFDVWIIRVALDHRVDGPFHISQIVKNMYTVEVAADDGNDGVDESFGLDHPHHHSLPASGGENSLPPPFAELEDERHRRTQQLEELLVYDDF